MSHQLLDRIREHATALDQVAPPIRLDDVRASARHETGRGPRRSLVPAAASALIVVGGLVAIDIARTTGPEPSAVPPSTPRQPSHAPASDTGSAQPFTATRLAVLTWYAPEGADVLGDELVCRSPSASGGCVAVAGRRTVTYRTSNGQVEVITEYGPAESDVWQELVRSGEATDLDGHAGLTVPGNNELAGFTASADIRVALRGEAGTHPAQLVSGLTTHREVVEIPVVFGEAIASEEEFPRQDVADGSPARYYAGYVDTTGDHPCVGGVGVPWNSSGSCVPVEPDTLAVTVATPSPTGTILIATLPLRTATAVVTADREPQRELPIADASDVGYNLVFADLDGFIPRDLVAFDDQGAEIGRTTIVSNGGVPLGYLPHAPGN